MVQTSARTFVFFFFYRLAGKEDPSSGFLVFPSVWIVTGWIRWHAGMLTPLVMSRVLETQTQAKSLGVSVAFMFHAWVLPFWALNAWTAAWFVLIEIWVSSIFFSFQFVVNHEVRIADSTWRVGAWVRGCVGAWVRGWMYAWLPLILLLFLYS